MDKCDKIMFMTIKIFILIWFLFTHNNDGNIWGIWIEWPILKIGDFWGSLAEVYLIRKIYLDIKGGI